jgi:hypothetical protein
MLVGTLVAAGFVVAVVTAVAAPWPTYARSPLVVEAPPVPSSTVLACAGGLLAIGRDAGSAAQLSIAAPQAVTAGSAPGGPAAAESTLSAPFLAGGTDPGPAVVTVAPSGAAPTDAAAAGSAVVSADDLRGFAASACLPPLMESWLVGGATTTGAADLVLLANPGGVPATVDLTVYGSQGAQSPPGGRDIVVAAGQQIVIPLAGLALGEESPVVRMTAGGAPVQASLQSSLTRTLVPGGVDQMGAVAQSAADVVIPGVEVTAEPGPVGASDAATLARLLSPTVDTTATVTVSAVGSDVPALTPTTVQLTAGLPAEVQLGGLPVGRYVVRVQAVSPVLAATWQTTGFDAGADFAWYTPSPELTAPTVFAVPTGARATLTIANSGTSAASVSVESVLGAFSQAVSVPAGGSIAVPVPGRDVYALDPGTAPGIHAGLSFAGDGALAGFPVWPSDAAVAPVRVYP